MKRILIVNSNIDWIDRNSIKPGDQIDIIAPDKSVAYVCSFNEKSNVWEVKNGDHKFLTSRTFVGLFEGENKILLSGFKFYKVETEKDYGGV